MSEPQTEDQDIKRDSDVPEAGDKAAPADPHGAADASPLIASAESGRGSFANFAGQYFIHTGRRMPHLDQGPVKAYAAATSEDASQETYYALVCEPALTPNSRSASSFSSVAGQNVVRLVASGAIDWPPAQGQRYVFIYETPSGKPLTAEGHFGGLGWKPELVQTAVVKPLLQALIDMRNADLSHGNIRPSNMFAIEGVYGTDRIVLGECLSTPVSYCQPVLFETVERAMADPIARGPVSVSHDLYAMGVSLAVILRHRDPMEGFSDEEIIQHKVEQGSYIALTGKDRFSGDILELLRGLLNDDHNQRWSIEDVSAWLDKQRLTPKQGIKRVKAARPIHFMEERYTRPALLAYDLNKNQTEAAQIIENDTLGQWVNRSLEDNAIRKRLESAIETTEELGRGAGYLDRLLCRVSIALDPEAPIRYKGLKLYPEGFGKALTSAIVRRADLQPFVELITQQTVMFWLSSQTDSVADVGTIASRFDSCRAFVRQTNIAYGVERCNYFLNPESPCLSDKVKKFYARTPEDLINAFEVISTRRDRPELFMDRHVAAFLSVKERQVIDPYLIELGSEDLYKRVFANVKVMASVQSRLRLGRFPGICRWISEILDPVYERFHDRELRRSIKSRINQLAENGDIGKIVAIVDNANTVQKDTENYNHARKEYQLLRQEDEKLEKKLRTPEQFASGVGREVAALVSCLLSGMAILVFVFMAFSKGTLF